MTTKKTKLNIIKPQLGFVSMTDADLAARALAVHDGMAGNAAYPSPPVDMPGLKAAIDSLTPQGIVHHLRRCPPGEFTIVTLGPKGLQIAD